MPTEIHTPVGAVRFAGRPVAVLVAVLLLGGLNACSAEPPPTTGAAVDIMRSCLHERGWEVAVDREEGSLHFKGEPADADRYEIDAAECAQELPASGFSDEELTSLYRKQVATVSCLREHGFSVPDPVSKDEFEAGIAGEREPWTAFSLLSASSQDEWDRAERLCPQPTGP